MKFFKLIFDFYINSSIHVALSCYALVRMTQHMFHIPYENSIAYFVFFGTVVGYNFVKYDALARKQKVQMRYELKAIALLSFCCLLVVGYYFFVLELITQIIAFVFLSFTLLYTLPFFPNRRNARNWAGVKIYIVALCWVGVTLILPILNAEVTFTTDFYLKCMQRFILIFVLILIFEILDLANDDPHLQTVPQQIGVKRTKNLGLALIILFFFLEFLKSNFEKNQIIVNVILIVLVGLFLIFANEKRSKYYTSFWVESIPILWWLMVVFL
ncbi:hypothetical protein SAMN05444396_107125 [Flavobacterium segetis]|uniref:Prenyltransferase n=1 Tax=Flavobacterium segetis TaxID=271157 RepID=A0A1M5IKQ6_9FLAO|nr:hypothetical protein [Flavobacterium segetis]SHG28867.1 hypothetical protein SAMN05444396_107125 [Flavobacterium segetis]